MRYNANNNPVIRSREDWLLACRDCKAAIGLLTKQLHRNAKRGDTALVQTNTTELHRLTQLQRRLHGMTEIEQLVAPAIHTPVTEPASTTPLYITTSGFLADCFAVLDRQPEEVVYYVTGPKLDRARLLTQRIEFALAYQSMGRALADPGDQSRALAHMAQFNMPFWAHFHSHPGSGVHAVNPSPIDHNYQSDLEALGHKQVIGAIFAPDTNKTFVVRFWPKNKSFDIQIQGEGVTQIDKQLYVVRRRSRAVRVQTHNGARRGYARR